MGVQLGANSTESALLFISLLHSTDPWMLQVEKQKKPGSDPGTCTEKVFEQA